MKHEPASVHVSLQRPPLHVSEHVEPGSHVYWQFPVGHVSVHDLLEGQSHEYAPASFVLHTNPTPLPIGGASTPASIGGETTSLAVPESFVGTVTSSAPPSVGDSELPHARETNKTRMRQRLIFGARL